MKTLRTTITTLSALTLFVAIGGVLRAGDRCINMAAQDARDEEEELAFLILFGASYPSHVSIRLSRR